MTLGEYISKGSYIIIRKMNSLLNDIWELKSSQFSWMIENWIEENKEAKKPNGRNTRK